MNTTTDDFRILPLLRDRDALLLIGVALLALLVVVAGLAFLPDEAWQRLEQRSKLLWGALVAVAPILLLGWKRLELRKASVLALGHAASAGPTATAVVETGEPR